MEESKFFAPDIKLATQKIEEAKKSRGKGRQEREKVRGKKKVTVTIIE